MTITNMIGGGGVSGPKVPLNAISVITAIRGNAEATIKWTDPSDIVVNGVTVATWISTKLVRKVGSAPTSVSDGTLVLTETVKDTYSVTGYTDTGLTNGTTYYYAAFAIADNGLATISSITPNVTPGEWTPGVNTLVYYNINDNDTNSTIYDLSGNNVNQTWYGTPSYTTDATYGRVASFNGSSYTKAGSRVNFGNEVTFIALVKNSATGQQAIVAECASSSTWNIGLTVDDSLYPTGWFSGNSNGNLRVIDNNSVTVGTWYMIAATRDSNGVAKIYINGAFKTSSTLSGTPTYTGGENLQIGRWSSSFQVYLNGDFKLFIGENRTWSDAEIATLAQQYGF